MVSGCDAAQLCTNLLSLCAVVRQESVDESVGVIVSYFAIYGE